jgi:hypothetical protein
MKVACCVCNRQKEESDGQTYVLTNAEKATLVKSGQTPLDKYFYCRPCFRMISDPEKAAQLIKGVVQVTLTAQGNPKAEEIATRYYQFYLRNGKRKS